MKEDNAKEKKKLEDHQKMLEDETTEFIRLTTQHSQSSSSLSSGASHLLGTLGKGKKK
jgi:hypothetical protein